MTEKRFIIEREVDVGTGRQYAVHLIDTVGNLPRLIFTDPQELYEWEKAFMEEWTALKKENEYLHKYNNNLQKQPLLFDVQTIPNTMEILEANTQLEKENEELKHECNYLQNRLDDFINAQKENEQLKQQNSRLMMEVAEYSRELRKCKGDVE